MQAVVNAVVEERMQCEEGPTFEQFWTRTEVHSFLNVMRRASEDGHAIRSLGVHVGCSAFAGEVQSGERQELLRATKGERSST